MKERKNRNITIHAFIFAFYVVNIVYVIYIINNILEHTQNVLGVEVVYLTLPLHIFSV